MQNSGDVAYHNMPTGQPRPTVAVVGLTFSACVDGPGVTDNSISQGPERLTVSDDAQGLPFKASGNDAICRHQKRRHTCTSAI